MSPPRARAPMSLPAGCGSTITPPLKAAAMAWRAVEAELAAARALALAALALAATAAVRSLWIWVTALALRSSRVVLIF